MQQYQQQDSHCYRHPDRFAGVKCARCGQPICPECMRQASVGWHCPTCVHQGARSSPTIRWRPTNRPTALGGRMTPVTAVLIAINVVVFIWSTADPSAIDRYGMVPQVVQEGQWYRLITAAFFHFNLIHIGLNMVMLAIVGPSVELDLGRVRYVALYLLAALGGDVCAYLLSPLDTLSAGASGAIFGLFGAYFLLARRTRADTSSAVALIVINLLFSFIGPGISWQAHVGGLIVGLVVAAGYAVGRGRGQVSGFGRAAGLGWIAGLGSGSYGAGSYSGGPGRRLGGGASGPLAGGASGRRMVAVVAMVLTSAVTLGALIALAELPPGQLIH